MKCNLLTSPLITSHLPASFDAAKQILGRGTLLNEIELPHATSFRVFLTRNDIIKR